MSMACKCFLSKVNNPDSAIVVNKIVDEHNHNLRVDALLFEQNKKFSEKMMEDIQFLKRFLEGKYPFHPIYSEDLYNAIKKFHPTAKSLSNDAAQVSDWLNQQKEKDPR